MKEEKNFFAPSLLKATIFYIIGLFIISTIASIAASIIYGSIHAMDTNAIVQSYFSTEVLSKEIQYAKIVGQGYGNFFGYLFAFIGIAIWMRNDFKEDYQILIENKKKYAILTPAFAIGFVAIALCIDLAFSNWVGSSENQNTIETLLHSSAAIPMIIATVILAPIVEEMIYRKAIFKAFRAYGVVPAYITSIILFTLPHMLTTQTSIGIWILQCIPYLVSASLLCVIYHKSNQNIYVSIAAHMLNNIIAVILVFAGV